MKPFHRTPTLPLDLAPLARRPMQTFLITALALVLACSIRLPGQDPLGPGAPGPAPIEGQPIDPRGLEPFAELYDVEWTVDEAGRTWMSPSPSTGWMNRKEPVFLDADLAGRWGRAGSAAHPFLADGFRLGGAATWLNIVAFGKHDIVSLTDAEHHFRRLRIPTDAEALLARIRGDTPVLDSDAAPLLHRASLDRILAIRLAAQLKLKRAVPDLIGISASPELPPILRRAAAEAAAEIDGRTFSGGAPALSPLEVELARLPRSADAIGVLYGERMPDTRALGATARHFAQEMTRRDILLAGGTCSPAQLAGGMKVTGMAAVLPYEVARVFGNARVRRAVFGASQASQHAMVVADGMFDPAHLGPAIEAWGVEAVLGADGTLRGRFEGGSLEVTATRAEVRLGDFEPLGEGLTDALGAARPGATSAWWFWIKDASAIAPDLPFLADAASPAILDLAFVDGTQLAAQLDYESEGAARVARDALRNLPAMVLSSMPGRDLRDLFSEWLRPLDVQAEGTRVTLQLELPTVQEMVTEQARAVLR